MPVNFRPHLQGASHIIEQSDIVLVRGTPIFYPNVGMFDTRICIRAHGFAERAMWLVHPKRGDALGAKDEFHLWSHALSQDDVKHVRDLLMAVWMKFEGFEVQLDGQDVGITMSFWMHDKRYSTFLHQSGDLRSQYSDAQVSAFVAAYEAIDRLVPTCQQPIDPRKA